MISIPSYTLLVLLFSLTAAILVLLLLSKVGRRKSNPPRIVGSKFILILVLLLIIGPSVFYSLQHFGTFFDPDCKAYIADSNVLSLKGHIPDPKALAEDPYYAQFPIFTLILNTLAQTTGMSSTMSMYVINTVIEILFWLGVWCLLNMIEPNHGKMAYVSISMIVVAYANVYLYGYFEAPLPQTLGISVLILLLLCSLKTITTSHILLYMLLSVLGIVHLGVIPFLFVVMLCVYLGFVWSKGERDAQVETRSSRRISASSVCLVFPVFVLAFYVALTAALNSAVSYSQIIAQFIFNLSEKVTGGSVAVSPGYSRGLLAPLNALAPSFVIGSNLALIAWYAYSSLRTQKEPLSRSYFAISLVSVMAIAIGSLRQRFDVIGGYGSISRYFALPGYALGTIGTLVVLNTAVFPLILDKSSNRAVRVFLVVILILIIVGGILDPLAFRLS